MRIPYKIDARLIVLFIRFQFRRGPFFSLSLFLPVRALTNNISLTFYGNARAAIEINYIIFFFILFNPVKAYVWLLCVRFASNLIPTTHKADISQTVCSTAPKTKAIRKMNFRRLFSWTFFTITW